MRYLVCGTGAIGGYFGGRLLEQGQKVDFLARGKRLENIKRFGLRLTSPKGDCELNRVRVSDKIKSEATYDVVFIAVKSYQLKDVVDVVRPIVDKKTLVIPLLNGVNNFDVLVSLGIESHQIVVGFANIICRLADDGVVEHIGAQPHITLGYQANKQAENIQEMLNSKVSMIINDLQNAGVNTSFKPSIASALWGKYLFVAPWAALSSIVEQPLGKIRQHEESFALLKQLIIEYQQIAKAEKVEVSEKVIHGIHKAMNNLPEQSKTSMQQDVEQGKACEFGSLIGDAIALADYHQLAVPILRFCYACLLTKLKN
ncbi:ketopantoate reductase family protein [Thalassotalea ganghwensis]